MGKFLVLAFSIFMVSAHGKLVLMEDKLYLRNNDKQTPLELVNDLIKKKKVTKIKLYGEGRAHIVSFSKDDGKEKLYSVDDKGFVYSIEPFTNYQVKKVTDKGLVQFKEVPKRSYRIDSKGFFLY